MRLLLDTHVLIWWDAGQRLSAPAKKAIRDADEVFVSAASAWEVAIKASLGKISSSRTIAEATSESGFVELPITFEHTARLRQLPALHRDPFDRMLVAQAISENCVLVTRDTLLKDYGVKLIKA